MFFSVSLILCLIFIFLKLNQEWGEIVKKTKFIAIPVIGLFFLLMGISSFFAAVAGGTQDNNSSTQCDVSGNPVDPGTGSGGENFSRMQFAQTYREAYIQGWANYGFLPSANLVQAIVETSLDPSVPSFGDNHNSGGVKWFEGIRNYDTYKNGWSKSPQEAGTGGSIVGDGTGGAYVWYKDYAAGIIGKAEFLARNPRYSGAVNNTSPQNTFKFIFEGGWATDPGYLITLNTIYNAGGIPVSFLQDMDREAIERYGTSPYKQVITNPDTPNTGGEIGSEDNCGADVGEGTENGAPVLEIPSEYVGKVSPMPDTKTYPGNNYPFGQCTWGAYNRMAQLGTPIEWFSGDGGNGGSWGQSAQAAGYNVIKGKPTVGWAVSFPGGVAGSSPGYGHIAVVEYVNPDGSFLVSETNVINGGSGTRSWRVISAATGNLAYFIQGRK